MKGVKTMQDITDEKLNDIKSAVLKEIEKELLAEYGIEESTWADYMIDCYHIRQELGIDEMAFEQVQEKMYLARKSLDTMRL